MNASESAPLTAGSDDLYRSGRWSSDGFPLWPCWPWPSSWRCPTCARGQRMSMLRPTTVTTPRGQRTGRPSRTIIPTPIPRTSHRVRRSARRSHHRRHPRPRLPPVPAPDLPLAIAWRGSAVAAARVALRHIAAALPAPRRPPDLVRARRVRVRGVSPRRIRPPSLETCPRRALARHPGTTQLAPRRRV